MMMVGGGGGRRGLLSGRNENGSTRGSGKSSVARGSELIQRRF